MIILASSPGPIMQDGRLGLGTRGYDHTILGIRPTSMVQDQATMVMTCFLPPKLPLNEEDGHGSQY